MSQSFPLRATVLAAVLAAPLLACAQQSPEMHMSGSSVPPADNANAGYAPGDVVGGGGKIDQTYREIYSPGSSYWNSVD